MKSPVVKDFQDVEIRILNGIKATSQFNLFGREDFSVDTINIVIGGSCYLPDGEDPEDLKNTKVFEAAKNIAEALCFIEGRGKADLVVTDYEGLKHFAPSTNIQIFVMIPFMDSEDQLDFVLDFRMAEKSINVSQRPRPLAGYRDEIPLGIVKWQNEKKGDWGESLDFHVGNYMRIEDGTLDSAWLYSAKLIKEFL